MNESQTGKTALRFLATMFVILTIANEAVASGLFLPARFGRSQAMGGTGLAVGNDLSVIAENPGLLSEVTGTSLMVNYHLYFMKNSFQRKDPSNLDSDGQPRGEELYPETGNTSEFLNHIPNLFVGSDFGVDGLNVSLALWSPIGPRHVYDQYGPQRYSMVFNKNQLLYGGLGAAYKIIPQLSIGATLAIPYVDATQHIGLMVLPEASSTDGLVKLHASGMGIMGIIGVNVRPIERMSIGLSWQSSVLMELEGEVVAEVPALTGHGVDYGSDGVIARQRLPEVYRIGMAYLGDAWSLEAAAKLYRWSQYDKLEADLETGQIGDFTLEDIVILKNNHDAASFHIGGEYWLTENHALRLGGFYDMSAIDPNNVSITEFDAPKVAVTLGYGFLWNGLTLNFSGMNVFYQSVESDNSALAPISAFGTETDIGTGTYKWNVFNVGGSIGYRF